MKRVKISEIKKINKIRSWLIGKISKFDKFLSKLIMKRKKREDANIMSEIGNITTDPTYLKAKRKYDGTTLYH